MMLGAASWRSLSCRTVLALTAALAAGSAAQAQNFVRPPNLNIGPRAPVINNPNVGMGVNVARMPAPNIAAHARLVGDARRDRAGAAGRRDRRGACQ